MENGESCTAPSSYKPAGGRDDDDDDDLGSRAQQHQWLYAPRTFELERSLMHIVSLSTFQLVKFFRNLSCHRRRSRVIDG